MKVKVIMGREEDGTPRGVELDLPDDAFAGLAEDDEAGHAVVVLRALAAHMIKDIEESAQKMLGEEQLDPRLMAPHVGSLQ
jgi:hypothetical protein